MLLICGSPDSNNAKTALHPWRKSNTLATPSCVSILTIIGSVLPSLGTCNDINIPDTNGHIDVKSVGGQTMY